MAIAVAIYMAIAGAMSLCLPIHPTGHALNDVVLVYAKPLIAGAVAVAIGWFVARRLPPMRGRDLLSIAVVVTIAVPVYLAIIRWIARADWTELSVVTRGMFARDKLSAAGALPGGAMRETASGGTGGTHWLPIRGDSGDIEDESCD